PPLSRVLPLYTRNWAIIVPFVVLVLVALSLSFLPYAHLEGGKFSFLPVFNLFVFISGLTLCLLRRVGRTPRPYVMPALAVLLGTMAADLVEPGLFSDQIFRAAGLAQNPNTASFYVVAMCAVCLRYGEVKVVDIALLAVCGIAVFATLSRAGIVLFAVLVVFYMCNGLSHLNAGRQIRVYFYVVVFSLISVVAVSVLTSESGVFEIKNATTRLSELARVESYVNPDDLRARLIFEYVGLIQNSPILGYGTGFSFADEVGPHNIYLSQWVNNGLPGLLAYLALLGAGYFVFSSRQCREGQAFILVVALYGVFSHNILDRRVFLLLFGMLCAQSCQQLARGHERQYRPPGYLRPAY
ncbi:MAG: O-antigen ligase family protein, partial [Gammaproteobacteria bacterium]